MFLFEPINLDASTCKNTPGTTSIVKINNPTGVVYEVNVIPSKYSCQVPNGRMVEQAFSLANGLTQETTGNTTETCKITGAYKPISMSMNQGVMYFDNVLPPLESEVKVSCSYMSQNQLNYSISKALGVTPKYYTPINKNANTCQQRKDGLKNVEVICPYPSLNDALSDVYGFKSDGYKANALNMEFAVKGNGSYFEYKMIDKDIVGESCSNNVILNSACISKEFNRALGLRDDLNGKKESYGITNQPTTTDLVEILNQIQGFK